MKFKDKVLHVHKVRNISVGGKNKKLFSKWLPPRSWLYAYLSQPKEDSLFPMSFYTSKMYFLSRKYFYATSSFSNFIRSSAQDIWEKR